MTMKPAKGLQATRHSLERACREKPDDEVLVIELVGVLEHLEDYDHLLELIETAIERLPNSLNLRLSRARIVASLGGVDAAREDYRSILEMEPGHVEATCALVQAQHGADVGGMEGIDNLLSFTVEDWARFYGLYEALMQCWRPILGNTMLEVKYEELVGDFNGQSRRMVDFLETDWSDNCLRPEQAQRAVRTASFKQVRQGVHTNSVDRWMSYERPLRELEPLIRESREWITAQTVA